MVFYTVLIWSVVITDILSLEHVLIVNLSYHEYSTMKHCGNQKQFLFKRLHSSWRSLNGCAITGSWHRSLLTLPFVGPAYFLIVTFLVDTPTVYVFFLYFCKYLLWFHLLHNFYYTYLEEYLKWSNIFISQMTNCVIFKNISGHLYFCFWELSVETICLLLIKYFCCYYLLRSLIFWILIISQINNPLSFPLILYVFSRFNDYVTLQRIPSLR